jgi:hypothetical protein
MISWFWWAIPTLLNFSNIILALPFPLCKTTFIVGWVEVRNLTPLTILPLMLGFTLFYPTLYLRGMLEEVVEPLFMISIVYS